MLEEVAQNKPVYTKLQGGKKLINKIVQCLEVETLKTSIGEEKWLNKLSHGHILANLYQLPIIFLSLKESLTFLPLQFGPGSNNLDPVYLLQIDGKHWVLAEVEVEEGVKPIPPPFLVPQHTSKSGQNWLTHIQKGRDLYEQKATQAV
jgi:hypothetical protein